ncbi:MAG: hypothetical protein CHACPFDD_03296 [Phycisphaerae bacterium]|nr:hypothetical protein [Phycisphaerae bacterium]
MIAEVRPWRGRPVLFLDGAPTTETWCYGWPNAIRDFLAAGLRICQFHVASPSWWTGPERYDFSRVEAQIDEFLAASPRVLLVPRVCFGFEGEDWWAAAHPDELSIGLALNGQPVKYRDVGPNGARCWQSAGSDTWTRDASTAIAAFVRHFEARNGDPIVGYQIGAGISVEWFRWWNFIPDVYEDYSPAAARAFRRFLRERYGDDDALRRAWNQPAARLDDAVPPSPLRLHHSAAGFLRDPGTERDVIDWLEWLSIANADQLIALCRAAKAACGGRKLVGSFYGYLWPHWNTQNPARSGHMAVQRVLETREIDYISSPYHYDNRGMGGVHSSQTVPASIALAGKLHLDEIDTFTHLAVPHHWGEDFKAVNVPQDVASARALLRRDAASLLGMGGSAWWMDLLHERWYADAEIQREVATLDRLLAAQVDATADSRAEVALVIDEASYAYCDLQSNLNLFFSSLPRQFEWSDLGFAIDHIRLADVPRRPPYRVYVFLNAWYVPNSLRVALAPRLTHPGTTSVWFHAAGYFSDRGAGVALAASLTGFECTRHDSESFGDVLLDRASLARCLPTTCEDASHLPDHFAPTLAPDRVRRTVHPNPRGWDTPLTPWFSVDEPAPASVERHVLGRYRESGDAALVLDQAAGNVRRIYCAAPMLPGDVLRAIARQAGVHIVTRPGCAVHQRGDLLGVSASRAGEAEICAPPGCMIAELTSDETGNRQARGAAAARCGITLERDETRFFRVIDASK